MKALVLAAPGAVELRDEPEPLVREDERLVHVRSAGICGSELHGARTPGFRQPPLIMGHEFASVTEQGDRAASPCGSGWPTPSPATTRPGWSAARSG